MKERDLIEIQNIGATTQVLSSLFQNPALLLDSNYSINVDDFPEKFHSILFSAMNNLFANGNMTFDIPSICNYISNSPTNMATFEANNGVDYIETIRPLADLDNFEHNYRMVKKFTILRDLAKNGVDITEIYDIRETEPRKIEKMQDRIFSMSGEDMINFFMLKMNDIAQKHSLENTGVHKANAGSRVREVIDRFKEAPDIGMKLYNEWYNTSFRGGRLGKFYLESAGSGCVDMDTEFFNGYEWKKISEYKEGDKVLQYNEDESANLVLPERYVKVPCKEFNHFETTCGVDQTLCDEHNMVFLTHSSSPKLIKMPYKTFEEKHMSSKIGFRGRIPTAFNYVGGSGIDLTNEEIRLMVAIIADGCFPSEVNLNKCVINFKKERKKKRIEKLLNDAKIEYTKFDNDKGYSTYRFLSPRREKTFTNYWYNCSKEQLDVVANEVLYWDGSIREKRRSFSTTSKESADFIQFVFSSLGMRASIHMDNRLGQEYETCGKTYVRKSINYYVCVSSQSSFVGIDNKKEKMKIQRVESIDGYKYCFTVDSGALVLRRNGRIFVTGNCGKSRRQIREATFMSVPYLYNLKTCQWEHTGIIPQKTTYICTELEEDEILPIAIAFLSGIDEEKLKMNELNEDEENRVVQAIDLMETYNGFDFVCVSDYDINDLEKIILDKVLREKCHYFFFDYIHSTAKSLSYYGRTTGVKLQEHQVLFLTAVSLKALCQKYKIFLYSATQINSSGMGGEVRDEQALRGSKAIADKIDAGVILSRVTKQDLEKLKDLVLQNFGKSPTHCTAIYKNRGGRLRGVFLWSIMSLSNMREQYLFATNENYEPITFKMLEIVMAEEGEIEEEVEKKVLVDSSTSELSDF